MCLNLSLTNHLMPALIGKSTNPRKNLEMTSLVFFSLRIHRHLRCRHATFSIGWSCSGANSQGRLVSPLPMTLQRRCLSQFSEIASRDRYASSKLSHRWSPLLQATIGPSTRRTVPSVTFILGEFSSHFFVFPSAGRKCHP